MNMDWNDYRWLVTDEGRGALTELANSTAPPESLAPQLRKRFSANITHRLIEQTELRRRAIDKFAHPELMLFTSLGLEQATDEWVASYKAERFTAGQTVADLCCGIGGDLLALARRGPAVGVDRDPLAVWLARNNAIAEAVATDVNDFDPSQVTAWHIDPDRRADGRRTTRVVDHQPGLDTIERLLSRNGNAAIKLAPAAEWPDAWNSHSECEWISREGECRQLVIWFGNLARRFGQRVATILDRRGNVLDSVTGPHQPCESTHGEIGRWLFEPDAAVIAAGLIGVLSMSLQLAQPTAGIAYLTANQLPTSRAVTPFEVVEVMPLDLKRLRAWFRDRHAECIEVKKRGVDIDPARVLRELRNEGRERFTLIVFPTLSRVVAVIAKRLSDRNAS